MITAFLTKLNSPNCFPYENKALLYRILQSKMKVLYQGTFMLSTDRTIQYRQLLHSMPECGNAWMGLLMARVVLLVEQFLFFLIFLFL